MLAAIALQLLLPARLSAGPHWLLPGLEGALLVGLSLATPRQLEHEHTVRRRAALAITAIVSLANVYSLVALTHFLLHNNVSNGRELITSGVLIWLTNFLIFALWYWEIDRGGPGRRPPATMARPTSSSPRCPTTASSRAIGVRASWTTCMSRSTNATAFSPTDTMPLTGMAKGVMGIQALVSLVTIGLIVSRA